MVFQFLQLFACCCFCCCCQWVWNFFLRWGRSFCIQRVCVFVHHTLVNATHKELHLVIYNFTAFWAQLRSSSCSALGLVGYFIAFFFLLPSYNSSLKWQLITVNQLPNGEQQQLVSWDGSIGQGEKQKKNRTITLGWNVPCNYYTFSFRLIVCFDNI